MIVCYVRLQSPTFILSMCCTAGTYSTCWASGIRHPSMLKTDSSSWSRAVMEGALKSKESIGLRATTPDWTANMSLCRFSRVDTAVMALGRFERQGQQSHRSAVSFFLTSRRLLPKTSWITRPFTCKTGTTLGHRVSKSASGLVRPETWPLLAQRVSEHICQVQQALDWPQQVLAD